MKNLLHIIIAIVALGLAQGAAAVDDCSSITLNDTYYMGYDGDHDVQNYSCLRNTDFASQKWKLSGDYTPPCTQHPNPYINDLPNISAGSGGSQIWFGFGDHQRISGSCRTAIRVQDPLARTATLFGYNRIEIINQSTDPFNPSYYAKLSSCPSTADGDGSCRYPEICTPAFTIPMPPLIPDIHVPATCIRISGDQWMSSHPSITFNPATDSRNNDGMNSIVKKFSQGWPMSLCYTEVLPGQTFPQGGTNSTKLTKACFYVAKFNATGSGSCSPPSSGFGSSNSWNEAFAGCVDRIPMPAPPEMTNVLIGSTAVYIDTTVSQASLGGTFINPVVQLNSVQSGATASINIKYYFPSDPTYTGADNQCTFNTAMGTNLCCKSFAATGINSNQISFCAYVSPTSPGTVYVCEQSKCGTSYIGSLERLTPAQSNLRIVAVPTSPNISLPANGNSSVTSQNYGNYIDNNVIMVASNGALLPSPYRPAVSAFFARSNANGDLFYMGSGNTIQQLVFNKTTLKFTDQATGAIVNLKDVTNNYSLISGVSYANSTRNTGYFPGKIYDYTNYQTDVTGKLAQRFPPPQNIPNDTGIYQKNSMNQAKILSTLSTGANPTYLDAISTTFMLDFKADIPQLQALNYSPQTLQVATNGTCTPLALATSSTQLSVSYIVPQTNRSQTYCASTFNDPTNCSGVNLTPAEPVKTAVCPGVYAPAIGAQDAMCLTFVGDWDAFMQEFTSTSHIPCTQLPKYGCAAITPATASSLWLTWNGLAPSTSTTTSTQSQLCTWYNNNPIVHTCTTTSQDSYTGTCPNPASVCPKNPANPQANSNYALWNRDLVPGESTTGFCVAPYNTAVTPTITCGANQAVHVTGTCGLCNAITTATSDSQYLTWSQLLPGASETKPCPDYATQSVTKKCNVDANGGLTTTYTGFCPNPTTLCRAPTQATAQNGNATWSQNLAPGESVTGTCGAGAIKSGDIKYRQAPNISQDVFTNIWSPISYERYLTYKQYKTMPNDSTQRNFPIFFNSHALPMTTLGAWIGLDDPVIIGAFPDNINGSRYAAGQRHYYTYALYNDAQSFYQGLQGPWGPYFYNLDTSLIANWNNRQQPFTNIVNPTSSQIAAARADEASINIGAYPLPGGILYPTFSNPKDPIITCDPVSGIQVTNPCISKSSLGASCNMPAQYSDYDWAQAYMGVIYTQNCPTYPGRRWFNFTNSALGNVNDTMVMYTHANTTTMVYPALQTITEYTSSPLDSYYASYITPYNAFAAWYATLQSDMAANNGYLDAYAVAQINNMMNHTFKALCVPDYTGFYGFAPPGSAWYPQHIPLGVNLQCQ